MITEKDFEDILCQYPELIEDGLILMGRQITLYGRRMDILFEDKFRRKLIIELKIGPIKDAHMGQILSYEGMLLSAEDPTIRVMLIGNRVPPNIQKSLDHHGIAWREITLSTLKDFLKEKDDRTFPGLLGESELHEKDSKVIRPKSIVRREATVSAKYASGEELVEKLKISASYGCFKEEVLPRKQSNEAEARTIILGNMGALTHEHLRRVFSLVDYNYWKDTSWAATHHHNTGIPWFGWLLRPENAGNILTQDERKINAWFALLGNNEYPVSNRIGKLTREEGYRIKGISLGFTTLMLYLLDKAQYVVWWKRQHNGLRIVCELPEFNGRAEQYGIFNNVAKGFATQYGFEHTELDWVLTEFVNMSGQEAVEKGPGGVP